MTTRCGGRYDGVLKGDVIYFPHDGPQRTAETLTERVESLLGGEEFRLVLVGPEGERDNMVSWMLERSLVHARAHVCYNHLILRRAIDQAMGNPVLTPIPDFAEIQRVLASVHKRLSTHARHLSTQTAKDIEVRQETETDDIATVRQPAEELSAVALVSSSAGNADVLRSSVQAVQRAMRGTEGGNDVADSTAEDEDDNISSQENAVTPGTVARSRNPLNEWRNNGLHLMKLFRDTFPLMRYERCESDVLDEDANGEATYRSWPLTANGTLSNTQTRHLLLQFTTVAATNAALIFVLANQKQRHAVVRSVSARVHNTAFDRFVELVNSDDFWQRLEQANNAPDSVQARKLQRELLPLLALAGKSKPWGRVERGAFQAEILGTAERHGDPCVFATISPDDVHQVLTIRLAFRSAANQGFPSFAGAATAEASNTANLLHALRTGAAYTEGDDVHEFTMTFDDGKLQRLAATNAVATSLMYQVFVHINMHICTCSYIHGLIHKYI